MYSLQAVLVIAASLLSCVSAHGVLTSPQPRVVGPAFKAACGEQLFYGEFSNPQGNIQQMENLAKSQKDFNPALCNLWLCKAYMFADNTGNVQKYTPGQIVPVSFKVGAPHTGKANMSIVDTASNTMIGNPLIMYSNFASTATGVTANQTSFSITIPTDLGSKCSIAGACVLQHYWDSREAKQTYESCLDFTV